jgi:outer membrane murein-binding lipoprotein Lpp
MQRKRTAYCLATIAILLLVARVPAQNPPELPDDIFKPAPVIVPKGAANSPLAGPSPGLPGKIGEALDWGPPPAPKLQISAPQTAQPAKSAPSGPLSGPAKQEISLPPAPSKITVVESGSGVRAVPVRQTRTLDRPSGKTAMPANKLTVAVLAAAMFATSTQATRAADEVSSDPKELAKEVAKLKEELAKAKKKIEEHSGVNITLDTRIELLENELAELRKNKAGAKKVEALKPEANGKLDEKTTESFKGMGRLRLINEFTEEMSVLVNGKPFRILPGDEKLIPITPGEFNYQVLQLQRTPQERKILADETKTVRIYPIR